MLTTMFSLYCFFGSLSINPIYNVATTGSYIKESDSEVLN